MWPEFRNFLTTGCGVVALTLLVFDQGFDWPPRDPSRSIACLILALGLIVAADARNVPPPTGRA
jgi:hypothetical protein